ncbi:11159_t:CDS:2, partial [Funneliformis geosporum]
GFTYGHVDNENLRINEEWPGEKGTVVQFKTNTVLQYDSDLNVESWGFPALSKRPKKNFDINERKYVAELFKLHLGDLHERHELYLPNGLNYKKAIVDYLHKLGE